MMPEFLYSYYLQNRIVQNMLIGMHKWLGMKKGITNTNENNKWKVRTLNQGNFCVSKQIKI